MASPPYRSPAASPPNSSPSILPNTTARKRPAGMAYTSAPKRRKPSVYSLNSNHPLRQTSFPPEESTVALQRSPSVESDFTAVTGAHSVVTSAAGRKGKGKHKKGEGSVSFSLKSAAKETTGDRSIEGVLEEEEDDGDGDGDEEGAGDGMVDEGGRVDRAAEKKKMAVLIDAFNDDQSERYNTYRRVKLKKETVRRITNQTLSQSVPPSVITTLNGFTKVFIGTLIERALAVQSQYAAATASLATPPPQSSLSNASTHRRTSQDKEARDRPGGSVPKSQEEGGGEPKPQKHLGPLQPAHLREAFRRYRRDGEGGGAGVEGFSVGLGLPGTGAARIGGRRLFR